MTLNGLVKISLAIINLIILALVYLHRYRGQRYKFLNWLNIFIYICISIGEVWVWTDNINSSIYAISYLNLYLITKLAISTYLAKYITKITSLTIFGLILFQVVTLNIYNIDFAYLLLPIIAALCITNWLIKYYKIETNWPIASINASLIFLWVVTIVNKLVIDLLLGLIYVLIGYITLYWSTQAKVSDKRFTHFVLFITFIILINKAYSLLMSNFNASFQAFSDVLQIMLNIVIFSRLANIGWVDKTKISEQMKIVYKIIIPLVLGGFFAVFIGIQLLTSLFSVVFRNGFESFLYIYLLSGLILSKEAQLYIKKNNKLIKGNLLLSNDLLLILKGLFYVWLYLLASNFLILFDFIAVRIMEYYHIMVSPSVVQLMVSLNWLVFSLLLIGMSQVKQNRMLWFLGITYLFITLTKMIFYDFDTDTLIKIIILLLSGALLLILGYFYPLPPSKKIAN